MFTNIRLMNKKVTKKVTQMPTTISSPTPTGLQLFKFANCAAVKAAGVAPIRKATNPGLYELNASLDRDKDGVACDA